MDLTGELEKQKALVILGVSQEYLKEVDWQHLTSLRIDLDSYSPFWR